MYWSQLHPNIDSTVNCTLHVNGMNTNPDPIMKNLENLHSKQMSNSRPSQRPGCSFFAKFTNRTIKINAWCIVQMTFVIPLLTCKHGILHWNFNFKIRRTAEQRRSRWPLSPMKVAVPHERDLTVIKSGWQVHQNRVMIVPFRLHLATGRFTPYFANAPNFLSQWSCERTFEGEQ